MKSLKREVKIVTERHWQKHWEDPDLRGVDLNTKATHFNHNLRLTGKQAETANKILQECINVSRGTKNKVSNRKESRTNIQILLANLFVNRRPHSTIVGLSPNWWGKNMYTRAGDSTRKIIYAFEKLGYVKIFRGNEKMKRLARMTPTKKLLKSCPEFHRAVIYDPVQVVLMKGKKPIIVDENGQEKEGARPLIPYDKEHPEAIRVEKILKRINEVNSNADIRHGNRKVSPYQHAVFTENFNWGGRLYAKGYRHKINHQQLPDYERAEITINGEPIIELDYSGLHPRLLYAGEGIEYPLDECPYQKINQNPDVRWFLKMIFLPMINAEDWTSAEKAANDWLYEFKRKDRKSGVYKKRKTDPDKIELRERLQDLGITSARPLMKQFMETHQPIAKYLCNGSETGLELMNRDSKIALDVVNYFAKNGKQILCIHDSFIVQKRYKKRLRYAMDKVYQKHNQRFRCPIK